MVQTQIQLFLDATGRKAFPQWLRFFGKVARQFTGFVNIQLLQVEGSSSLGLVLIFESKASQNAFFESPVFAQLMKRMHKHSTKPFRKVVLRAKNLYCYKSKPPAKDKPATTASIVKPRAEAMQLPLKAPAPQRDNVVGMAAFMSTRKQN